MSVSNDEALISTLNMSIMNPGISASARAGGAAVNPGRTLSRNQHLQEVTSPLMGADTPFIFELLHKKSRLSG